MGQTGQSALCGSQLGLIISLNSIPTLFLLFLRQIQATAACESRGHTLHCKNASTKVSTSIDSQCRAWGERKADHLHNKTLRNTCSTAIISTHCSGEHKHQQPDGTAARMRCWRPTVEPNNLAPAMQDAHGVFFSTNFCI